MSIIKQERLIFSDIPDDTLAVRKAEIYQDTQRLSASSMRGQMKEYTVTDELSQSSNHRAPSLPRMQTESFHISTGPQVSSTHQREPISEPWRQKYCGLPGFNHPLEWQYATTGGCKGRINSPKFELTTPGNQSGCSSSGRYVSFSDGSSLDGFTPGSQIRSSSGGYCSCGHSSTFGELTNGSSSINLLQIPRNADVKYCFGFPDGSNLDATASRRDDAPQLTSTCTLLEESEEYPTNGALFQDNYTTSPFIKSEIHAWDVPRSIECPRRLKRSRDDRELNTDPFTAARAPNDEHEYRVPGWRKRQPSQEQEQGDEFAEVPRRVSALSLEAGVYDPVTGRPRKLRMIDNDSKQLARWRDIYYDADSEGELDGDEEDEQEDADAEGNEEDDRED